MKVRNGILLSALLASLGPQAFSQAFTLPANSPTQALLPSGTAGPISNTAQQAEVTLNGSMLRVVARNGSLNQILREVARQAGMTISGTVAEDRVFGTYGPASAEEVLASLLDGTSTNILIANKTENSPGQLILTARSGGPTPPNPNAAANDAAYQPPQQPSFPPQQPPFRGVPQSAPPIVTGPPGATGIPPSNGGQTGTPINGGADLGTTPGAFIPAGQTPPDATAQPSTQTNGAAPSNGDPAQPQSPNGVSTPQQIYEQLMRLRQQQQQQPTNPQ